MQRACRRTRGTGLWKLIKRKEKKRKEKRKFDQFTCGDSGELLVLLFICMSRECTVSFRDERRASERTKMSSKSPQASLVVLAFPRQVEILAPALIQRDQKSVHFGDLYLLTF